MVDVVSEFSKSLRIMTGCLANFLSGVLPSICSESDDWWRTHVFDKLSYRQQRRVEEKKINSLSGLDLQALLRILDKNWYAISEELTLSQEQLHYVKEMITVRNRWFHADATGPPIEDQYRDIDTIQRVAKIINAKQELNETVNSIKLELGNILAGPPGKIPPGETKETEELPEINSSCENCAYAHQRTIKENAVLETTIEKDEQKSTRKRNCPKCGSDKVIPIVYGDIDGSLEVMQQIKNEEIDPGGCCVDEESPKWKCRDCNESFGKIDWV